MIVGSIQVVDNQMRIGGRIIWAETGQPIGSIQCDGNIRGLFDLEDLLSDRVRGVLRPAARSEVRPASPAALEVVGPSLATGTARYFDGDISSVIARPPRFRDDYDRYYYQSATSSSWGYCWGPWPCGLGGFGCGNGVLFPPAAPLSSW